MKTQLETTKSKFSLFFRLITKITPTLIQKNEKLIETSSINVSKGLFFKIKYVEGFFQSESFINDKPIIKTNIINQAVEYINNLKPDSINIFIHIREGDYNSYKVYNKSVKLEDEYFFEGIKFFNEKYKNVVFIFISDDIEITKKRFDSVTNSVFVSQSIYFDFALMTLCKGGIISNSSFSWWGAYLIKDPLTIIAPKYWLGRKSKQWYPLGIATKKFKYI